MAIKQLTVFVQNKKGTVVSVTDILAKNNVNIRALSIAETEDFGILRLIVNDEATAVKTLEEAGAKVELVENQILSISHLFSIFQKNSFSFKNTS